MADDKHEALTDAFAAFTEQLKQTLTEEAQRSVDGAIADLSLSAGPFRIEGVELEVVIRNINVTADAPTTGQSQRRLSKPGAQPQKRSRPKRKPSPARKQGPKAPRGRPAGAVRQGILAEFGSSDVELSVDDLRGRLEKRDVHASADNVHQQLRRLVSAGELRRVGRGVYARDVKAASS